MNSKVNKEEVKHSGKFLEFKVIDWTDKNGNKAEWESIGRKGDTEAVSIVPILVPSMKYVIIKIFRPTVDGYVITFPAGLVDKGESYEASAVRELKEETGYVGSVIKTTPPNLSSAGMTDELVTVSVVHIDESLPENQNPIQNLESDEDIEVWLVREGDIKLFIDDEIKKGSVLSGRFTSYLLGKDLI